MRPRVFTCLAAILIAVLALAVAQDLKPPDQEFVLEFVRGMWVGSSPAVAPVSEALDIRGDQTLEAWVLIKETSPGNVSLLVGRGPVFQDSSGPSIAVNHNGTIIATARCDGQTVVSPEVPVPEKKWSHLALTFHAGRMTFYVNGEL